MCSVSKRKGLSVVSLRETRFHRDQHKRWKGHLLRTEVHLCDPYDEGQTPNNAKNNSLLKERYLCALPIIGAKNCSSTLNVSSEFFCCSFFSSVFFFVNSDNQIQALLTDYLPSSRCGSIYFNISKKNFF